MRRSMLLALLLGTFTFSSGAGDALEDGFRNPPAEAKLRAYWWWLNGNVTRQSITRDLEEMAAKGFGGALICDAGGAEQDGNSQVPHGPDFFSSDWRELYRHSLREAARLGLELSLNIQSGWNLGGPMIRAEEAPKSLVWSEVPLSGPGRVEKQLPVPVHAPELYLDVAVIAFPRRSDAKRAALDSYAEKALLKALPFSAPDTSRLLRDQPDRPGEEDARSAAVVDLTGLMDTGGVLRWDVPAGEWEVLRFGCTLNSHSRVSTHSEGWAGYALDPFDAGAFARYWKQVVDPLIDDAGTFAGTTLKYLHTDSWEVEAASWTPALREEFRRRRGYDLRPFLPVIAGRLIDSRSVSNRFLHDFRRTMGDLAIDNHYRLFSAWAARRSLRLHPESGGPHAVPVDSLQCLGMDDAPMSEFWAWSWRHRVGDGNRFFVKQPASAAHTYGRRLVLAEGFTTIGPHWQETIWDNLKPAFDRASCEGLNRLVWHAFTCSPSEMGLPGQEYFAGTHFNPNSTWWSRSGPFLSYVNRTQFMLQQGLFVADAVYYYGDHVPNFAQLKSSDPAGLLPGFDYDVATEEVVLNRMSVRGGRIALPDGMSYRVLVLPDRPAISLPVLRKVRELVAAGATVIGTKPETATGLQGFPNSDEEVRSISAALWGSAPPSPGTVIRHGAGRVVAARSARDFLISDGVRPDFEYGASASGVELDYIHRRAGESEIYFVASRSKVPSQVTCTFRVSGKQPELWDPMTGERRDLQDFRTAGGRVSVPLEFAPYGSWFVVFRRPAPALTRQAGGGSPDFPRFLPVRDMPGPWTVRFDQRWGGPASAAFPELVSWATRPERGIRFYSGTGTYSKTFDFPPIPAGSGKKLYLDLGEVRQIAEVRLNGQNLGIVWAPPFRVEITSAVRAGDNRLEIDVVNFWPNRVIGDASLPQGERLTKTNIRKLTADTPLMESGLLGPVRILQAGGPAATPRRN